jgi:uncharacterized protein YndB with AHSA1/START domain
MQNGCVQIAPDTLRLTRRLPGPIERAWQYLTDPDKRRLWLAAGPMQLAAGGAVELVFENNRLTRDDDPPPAKYADFGEETRVRGKVTECDAPRVLQYTWDEGSDAFSEVRFELTAEHDGSVLLVLTHRRLVGRETILSVAAGWHTHVDILIDRLNGREPEGFWRKHTRVEADYETTLRT